MPALSIASVKWKTLTLRLRSEDRSLIHRAATARGKSRNQFIVDAARLAAEEALQGQTLAAIAPQACEAFWAQLDRPPQPNEQLCRTMQAPAPWDTTSALQHSPEAP